MNQSSSESKAIDPIQSSPVPTKRIAIFIVTYNAVSTLSKVLDRIPEGVWDKAEEIFVFDDSSQDDTYLVGLGYKAARNQAKLSIFRNEQNQGYGGNQIRGYRYAIEQGYDIVALLHGDGQYAPEVLPNLLAPLERGEADAVFGSRMMTKGGALGGGMPLYKYLGNKVLTAVENAALGLHLSEFHSGYRLYSVAALKDIPFDKNTNDFHFDTQIIIQLHAAGKRIVEVPIPTYYGDEICYVNGMKYARDVLRSVGEFQLHRLGLRRAPEYEVRPPYRMKGSKLASHHQLLQMVGPQRRRILDLGCGSGQLSGLLAEQGHEVVGVDLEPPADAVFEFVRGDLSKGVPKDLRGPFDLILFADVLEHLEDPKRILAQARELVAPGGRILVSLPNAVHWSVRAHVLFGRFEYTNEGLLDRGHLRFFTRSSAIDLFADAGLSVEEHRTTPVPWEKVLPSDGARVVTKTLERADKAASSVLPNLFAYQHLFVLRPGA